MIKTESDTTIQYNFIRNLVEHDIIFEGIGTNTDEILSTIARFGHQISNSGR